MSSSPEGPCRQILKACSQFPATSLGERAGEMRWSILEIGIWSPSAAENPELTLLLDSRVFFGGAMGSANLHTVKTTGRASKARTDHRAHDLLRLEGD